MVFVYPRHITRRPVTSSLFTSKNPLWVAPFSPQLAEVLWCFGVCDYSPEDGAVVRHLYLQASEREIPSMGEPHLQLLCQVHILLAAGWQGFPFGEDLQRLNASGWANKLSSVWDGVLRAGTGPSAMHRSVIGDEVALVSERWRHQTICFLCSVAQLDVTFDCSRQHGRYCLCVCSCSAS